MDRSVCMWPLAGLLLFVAGCMCYSTPSRVEAPKFNPASATAEAMQKYDSDSDGRLSAAELEQAGSIASGMEYIDTDGDGQVSEAELRTILDSIAGGVGRTVFSCQVTLDGRPLSGATLTFTPESFMQDSILPAVGTTDANGMANVANEPDQLPADQKDLTGTIQPGFYMVEVTHPQIDLPARYNTASTLGQVIAQETNREGTTMIELQSR